MGTGAEKPKPSFLAGAFRPIKEKFLLFSRGLASDPRIHRRELPRRGESGGAPAFGSMKWAPEPRSRNHLSWPAPFGPLRRNFFSFQGVLRPTRGFIGGSCRRGENPAMRRL